MASFFGGACAAAAVALLAVGYSEVEDRADAAAFSLTGEHATIDGWLGRFGLAHPTDELRALLATVPTDQNLYFVGPGDDSMLILLFYNVSALAFPRQVGLLRCDPEGGPPGYVYAPPDDTVGAALVWTPDGADPSGPGTQLGPFLRLVTDRGAVGWTSSCS